MSSSSTISMSVLIKYYIKQTGKFYWSQYIQYFWNQASTKTCKNPPWRLTEVRAEPVEYIDKFDIIIESNPCSYVIQSDYKMSF